MADCGLARSAKWFPLLKASRLMKAEQNCIDKPPRIPNQQTTPDGRVMKLGG